MKSAFWYTLWVHIRLMGRATPAQKESLRYLRQQSILVTTVKILSVVGSVVCSLRAIWITASVMPVFKSAAKWADHMAEAAVVAMKGLPFEGGSRYNAAYNAANRAGTVDKLCGRLAALPFAINAACYRMMAKAAHNRQKNSPEEDYPRFVREELVALMGWFKTGGLYPELRLGGLYYSA